MRSTQPRKGAKVRGLERDGVRNKLEWSNLTTTTILSYCMYPRMARPCDIRPFHVPSNNTTPYDMMHKNVSTRLLGISKKSNITIPNLFPFMVSKNGINL